MRRRWFLLLELLIVVGIVVWAAFSFIDRSPRPADSIDVKVQLRDAADRAFLFKDKDGAFRYQITEIGGNPRTLTTEEFAQRLYSDQHSRSWTASVLNVTSPVGFLWVTVGLLGQVLFTGRMVVQWLVSEKEKKSTVPTSFWWMSLVGASMLLVYFLWRKDPVGVLGQAFGWFIYLRNLWMIYRTHEPVSASEDPGPEPELR